MKIMVTGGSGWIGGHLVEYLKENGHEVFNYDILEGYDITDATLLRETFETFEPQQVYHLAAQAFMIPGEEDPERDVRINVFGMINLLRVLEDYPEVSMVYTSSGAVYGLTSELPHQESAKCIPSSNYGVSKLAAENYLRKWTMSSGVNARIIRFSSVYGPGRAHGAVNVFINKARRGEPITIFGDGKQTRDMVYIDDAITGLELAINKGGIGDIYNIGIGKEYSVENVAELVSMYFGTGMEYLEHKFSHFDLSRSWYNITKMRMLGYMPEYDLQRGILKTIREEREKRDDS